MANIPDVMAGGKNGYGLLLEYDRVRVREVRLKPGEKAPMHHHTNDHVVFVKNDSRLSLASPMERARNSI